MENRRENSTLIPQKVVSYKSFYNQQKTKFKASYPFLSADQINRKIQEKWKSLEQDQKEIYTRTTLKVTPIKDERKRKDSTKVSLLKPKRQKVEIPETLTPEYVNTRKLSDFHENHPEVYKNDFFDDQRQKDKDSSLHCSERNDNWSSTACTKMIDENTPRKNTGILKTRDSDKKAGKSFVSFCSPTEVAQPSVDTQDTTDDVRDGDCYDDSDDDNDALLIRRDFKEETTKPDVEPSDDSTYMTQDHDINPDKISVTRRRSNLYMIKNDLKSSKTVDTSAELLDNDIPTDKATARTDQENLFKSPLPNNSDRNSSKKKSKQISNQKRSTKTLTPIINTGTKLSNFQVTPVLSHGLGQAAEENDKYTTPSMDEVLQQLTLSEVNKAPQKRRQSQDNVSESQKKKVLSAGRRVTRSLLASSGDNLIDEFAKDPSNNELAKRKTRNTSNCTSNNSGSRQKAIKTAAENTKSKKNEDYEKETDSIEMSTPNDDGNTNGFVREMRSDSMLHGEMNPSGDASQCVTDIDMNIDQSTSDFTDNYGELEADFESVSNNAGDNETKRKTNQRKYAKKPLTNAKELKKARLSMDKDQDPSNVKEALSSQVSEEASQASILDMCGLDNSQSSTDISVVSTSPGSKWNYKKGVSNPTLERALRNLKCTAVNDSPDDSPCMSVHGDSDISSPRLLSPALSGVSEFSSMSRSSSEAMDDQPPFHNGPVNVVSVNADRDLCEMFQDVTPPERRSKGLYKTQRLLTSTTTPVNENFKQLFHDDGDFFA